MLDDIGVEVVQGAGEFTTEQVHKRWGWKGCLVSFVIAGGLISGTIYFLTR